MCPCWPWLFTDLWHIKLLRHGCINMDQGGEFKPGPFTLPFSTHVIKKLQFQSGLRFSTLVTARVDFGRVKCENCEKPSWLHSASSQSLLKWLKLAKTEPWQHFLNALWEPYLQCTCNLRYWIIKQWLLSYHANWEQVDKCVRYMHT